MLARLRHDRGFARATITYRSSANELKHLVEAQRHDPKTRRQPLLVAGGGAQVTAIDLSEAMFAKARAKLGADTVEFRLHDLALPFPFVAEFFDRVISGLVVDHISDLVAFFSRIFRGPQLATKNSVRRQSVPGRIKDTAAPGSMLNYPLKVLGGPFRVGLDEGFSESESFVRFLQLAARV